MSAAEGLTRAQLRAQLDHEHGARRAAEAACALDFLVYGDGEPTATPWGSSVPVSHAERCVFGPRAACSRTYDPLPYDEAEPVDRMYEGTGIGALYGLCPDVVTRTWDDDEGGTFSVSRPLLELEGWELAPRTVYE